MLRVVALASLFTFAVACGAVKASDVDAGDNANNSNTQVDASLVDAPPSCQCGEYEYCDNGTCEDATIFFLNFDPQNDVFEHGPGMPEDSTLNRHIESENLVGNLIGYGGGPARDTVLAQVQSDLAAYGVVVTKERPPVNVDYHMIVLTGSDPGLGVPVITLGSINCDNVAKRQVEFMFFTAEDSTVPDLEDQAKLVSYRIARTTGLDKVNASGDSLHQFIPDDGAVFTDVCQSIPPTIGCASQHLSYCGEGEQNSHAELSAFWGLRSE